MSRNDIELQDHRNAIEKSQEGDLRALSSCLRLHEDAVPVLSSHTQIMTIKVLYFSVSDRCPEELLPLLSQAITQEIPHCERTTSQGA